MFENTTEMRLKYLTGWLRMINDHMIIIQSCYKKQIPTQILPKFLEQIIQHSIAVIKENKSSNAEV